MGEGDEKFGVARVREALESKFWPNMQKKEEQKQKEGGALLEEGKKKKEEQKEQKEQKGDRKGEARDEVEWGDFEKEDDMFALMARMSQMRAQ